MAVRNSDLADQITELAKAVAVINQGIEDKKALCPYREDIHDGVLAKSEVNELAKAVNGKLDALRKDVKTMGERVTDNRISIRAWGGLIAGSGTLAAALVKVVDRFL